MPAISAVRLTDAKFLVGEAYKRLDGFGEDMFSCEPDGDVGAMLKGALGDVMFVGITLNAWLATLTFFTAGDGITTLNRLHSTNRPFPVKIEYGAWNLVGWGAMMNLGAVTAGLGNNTRTMTMNIAKVSGDTDAAPGEILQVLD